MDSDIKTVVVPSHSETMDVFAGASRFAQSLQARKGVLAFFLILAGALGATYYISVDRVYESEAEITVLQNGGNLLDHDTGQPRSLEAIMPTYERNVSCDRVIRETIRMLPREHLIDFRGVHPDRFIEAFRDRLSVSSPRDTNNIRMAYRSGDPETAFVVAGSLVSAYLNFTDGYYHENAEKSLQLLQVERDQQTERLHSLHEQKLRLINDSGLIVGMGEEMTNPLTESVKELNGKLVEATSRRIAADAQMQMVQQAIRYGGDLQQLARQMSESVGTKLFEKFLGVGSFDAVVASRMFDELTDLRMKLQGKQQYLLPRHPEIRDLKEEIASREAELRAQPELNRQAVSKLANEDLGPILYSMAEQEYQSAKGAEEALHRQFDQQSQKATGYSRHLQQIEMINTEIEQLHVSLADLSKSIANTGFGQDQGLRTQIVTDPRINRAPVSPKLSLVVLVCAVLGFTGGCATVFVLDLIDDRFHSAEDMKSQVGAPILTSIRNLKPIGENGLSTLYTFAKPNAPESESFRTLRTALDFSAGGVRRLTISSTQPGDGKTTVLSNLAVAFAQAGRRTLVIDGDMRCPGLTRLFQRSGHNGLSTILRDDRAIVESVAGLVYHTDLPNLHVLPAGPKPINPVELLTSERLSDLVAWAETQYDQVLIDAPPSLAVTDAAIIGRLVDGAILTVRPDRNHRKGVLRAAEALTALGCELLGIVLNKIEPTQVGYGMGYGYGYGYGNEELADEESGPAQIPTPATYKRAA